MSDPVYRKLFADVRELFGDLWHSLFAAGTNPPAATQTEDGHEPPLFWHPTN